MKRLRCWLIRKLFRTGGWIIHRHTTPSCEWWQFVDMRRHIAYDWVAVKQIRKNEWAVIGESARKELPAQGGRGQNE